jgi:DNA-binding NtrC family response regulator
MVLRILLISEDPNLRRRVRTLMKGADTLISTSGGGEEFWRNLSTETFDLLLVEETSLPRPVADTVAAVRNLPEQPDVVVLRKDEDSQGAAGLISIGCMATIPAGLDDTVFQETLMALLKRRRSRSQQIKLLSELPSRHTLDDVVFKSPAMRSVVEVARRVSGTDTTLLLLGETGVGKEWLARAIHEEGPRADKPFIAVNCSAIPETLLESELFGHEEGAFTGASRAHRGQFELAHRGTLFLDEIADTPLQLQAKLLRALQEKRIKRVGGEHEIETDARVMAATNRDLEAEMEARRFRPDLFYRIGVVTITVPPLRKRREDIADLVRDQFHLFQRRIGRELTGLEPEVMEALVAYDWPGNVRELINVIERAVLLCRGNKIRLADLPAVISNRRALLPKATGEAVAQVTEDVSPHLLEVPLKQAREEVVSTFERGYLTGLLQRTEGRIGVTARMAGITTRALYDKMRRYDLRKEDFKI